MVLCHSVLLTSYINELHKSEEPKLPQIIMALAPEVQDLHNSLAERCERPHKSVLGDWLAVPNILWLKSGIWRCSQDHGLVTLGWPWQWDKALRHHPLDVLALLLEFGGHPLRLAPLLIVQHHVFGTCSLKTLLEVPNLLK